LPGQSDVWELPDINKTDSCTIKKIVFTAPGKKSVALLSVRNGGHTWPGGKQYLGKKLIGFTNRDIDACEVIWEFFKLAD